MEKPDKRSFFKNLISCAAVQDKALAFLGLSLVSIILALGAGYTSSLLLGPTSLGTWFNPYWIGFFFVCCLLVSAFWVFRHSIKSKPDSLFLAIVLLTTCFSSLAFDVNKPSWDADYHFLWVVEWSQPGAEIELSVAEARMIFGSTTETYFNLAELQAYSQELNRDAVMTDGGIITATLTDLHNRVASLPGSLIYFLCTLLGIPFSLKYIFSRLIYALLYSLIVFLGMKQLKSGKMLYAVIALLPTALFLASNYGYDYWVNAFVLLGGASLVRELQTPDDPVTNKRIALLLGSFVIGLGPKLIYAPLVLLCLLIPKSKFSSQMASRVFRLIVILVCLLLGLSYLGPYIFSVAGTVSGGGDTRWDDEVNTAEQLALMSADPLGYLRILFAFLATDLYTFSGTRDFITNYCTLKSSSWPFWIWVLGLLALTTLTDKSDRDKGVSTWKSRVLAIGLHLVIVSLISTAMYLEFTAVGLDTINGVQGRYLIPLLFCSLVFLSSPKLAWPRGDRREKTIYNTVVLGSMAFVYMAGLWQVYIRLLY
ncbi:MAG: DUF2142 domain-containing protein [Coriobacteriia bacterium]|nr:DUF2142 domain-containing protein [Coriobacteriia bacterium]MCL2749536.1 DUF2142 domain-containing protein [Coriobacteriia bacterium]